MTDSAMLGPQFAEMARLHWEKHFPERVALKRDPEAFFAEIGEEAATEIIAMSQGLELAAVRENDPGTSFEGRLGLLNEADQTAQSTVLRRMVLLDPEQESRPEDLTDR